MWEPIQPLSEWLGVPRFPRAVETGLGMGSCQLSYNTNLISQKGEVETHRGTRPRPWKQASLTSLSQAAIPGPHLSTSLGLPRYPQAPSSKLWPPGSKSLRTRSPLLVPLILGKMEVSGLTQFSCPPTYVLFTFPHQGDRRRGQRSA